MLGKFMALGGIAKGFALDDGSSGSP